MPVREHEKRFKDRQKVCHRLRSAGENGGRIRRESGTPCSFDVSSCLLCRVAARLLVEPYLDGGEEAVGFEIRLKHIAPTKIGEEVEVAATLIKKIGKKLVCKIEATNARGKICYGTQTQVLIRKGDLD